MMANAVEMQQLLMSMDPSSANQFNMNKGGACILTSSGGSTSPTSSGAASSSSVVAEVDEKEQLQQHLNQNWMQMFMNQQQPVHQEKTKPSFQLPGDLSDLLQNGVDKNLLDIITNSNEFAKLAAQINGHTQPVEQEMEEIQETPATPPLALNNSLAAVALPTTSTSAGCSAASTTSSVDSTAPSVIVNGSAVANVNEDDEMPPAKRQRTGTEEETPLGANNPLMQTLLAQLGVSSPMAPQNQKALKDDPSLLFGGLFSQGIPTGLPLMFPSPLHQQFAGLAEFDQLSALSTPTSKGSGVKRQYSSNGKNYCDICNKEVCNKYFLRTHMLKMHGIVIDENKTVIANIDTLEKEKGGELSFRCDTCRTMFKTRNQLRQHRQDVHGILPLSTPRNNQNKPSVPNTPNGANNGSGPSSASLLDEKCQMCDKKFAPTMMAMHMMQEHFGISPSVTANPADLNHMMNLITQATSRTPSTEEKEPLLECSECSYKTPHQKNLELHLQRHSRMNEAKAAPEDEEDEALKMTTEAALQMVVQNQNQFEGGDNTAAALNLTFKNEVKKEIEEEKQATANAHERNSHTSGSISPSSSIPEGFGRAIGDKIFPTQTFLIRSNDESGNFLGEFLAQLPVRSMVEGPRSIMFELLPTPAVANGV